MRTLVFILLMAFIGLQYKLWLGEGGIYQWAQLERKKIEQETENKRLLTRNKAIEADIAELKSGDQALEEQARSELGMIKNGEVYYQFSE